jgi:hypothetical protein
MSPTQQKNERRRRQLDRVRLMAVQNGEPRNWPAQAAKLEREARKQIENDNRSTDRLVKRMREKEQQNESR